MGLDPNRLTSLLLESLTRKSGSTFGYRGFEVELNFIESSRVEEIGEKIFGNKKRFETPTTFQPYLRFRLK